MTSISKDVGAVVRRTTVDKRGCWNFDRLDTSGYGRIYLNGRQQSTHRITYESWNGPVPLGLEIDHLCRNTACCNPKHLEAVTHRENVLRGKSPAAIRAMMTHCASGHEFDDANTYRYRGMRYCRACRRQRQQEYRDKMAAA